MKPSDLKRVVEKLRSLGFEVSIKAGPVDRGNRPMSVKLDVQSRSFSIVERQAFAKFFSVKTR